MIEKERILKMPDSNDSSSSSRSLGRIVWQTQMSMSDENTAPAINDSFVSNRWNTSQENQGLIKYTQYVDVGRSVLPDHDEESSQTSAIVSVSMLVNDVEKVDFGWLEQPKFVCFTNSTPDGFAPVSIFIGVDNAKIRNEMTGDAEWSAEVGRPLWQAGAFAADHTGQDPYDVAAWEAYKAEHGIGMAAIEDSSSIDAADAKQWATENFCQEAFEIPPGVTVGPLIIPEGTTYWCYRNADWEESSGSSTATAAILITEAYDS